MAKKITVEVYKVTYKVPGKTELNKIILSKPFMEGEEHTKEQIKEYLIETIQETENCQANEIFNFYFDKANMSSVKINELSLKDFLLLNRIAITNGKIWSNELC